MLFAANQGFVVGNFNSRFTLIGADYSQIEMRILAHMSQDKDLISFFHEKKDIHYLIAARCLSKNTMSSS